MGISVTTYSKSTALRYKIHIGQKITEKLHKIRTFSETVDGNDEEYTSKRRSNRNRSRKKLNDSEKETADTDALVDFDKHCTTGSAMTIKEIKSSQK